MNKTVKVFMISLVILISSIQNLFVYAHPFTDIKKSAWYNNAVDYCYNNNYFTGVTKTTFQPKKAMTRAMFATVLYRLSGDKIKNKSIIFDDVSPSSVYAPGIAYCTQKGIVKGYKNNKFCPDNPITRQELMVMLYRYASVKGKDIKINSDFTLDFYDAKSIKKYAYSAALWCVNHGIINGTNDSKIMPNNIALRCEIAKVLMNYDECINKINMDKYYATQTNAYGIHIDAARFFKGNYYFNIMGIKKDNLIIKASYKIDNKPESAEQNYLNKGLNKQIYKSAIMGNPLNLGLKKSFSVAIKVYDNKKCIYSKTLKYNGIFINPDNKSLRYKGDGTFDSRILMYHHLTKKAPKKESYSVITTPEHFDQNIKDFKKMGYSFISLDMLKEFNDKKRALPNKTIAITFDDGYASNYTLAYPILLKYKAPATIFLTVSTAGLNSKLNWDQMQEMENSEYVTIQSHSWKHVNHAKLSVNKLNEYISKSFSEIENNLGKRKYRILAYPYGKYSDNSISIAKKYNVVMQMTVKRAPLDFNNIDLDRLPRIAINYDTDVKKLK